MFDIHSVQLSVRLEREMAHRMEHLNKQQGKAYFISVMLHFA